LWTYSLKPISKTPCKNGGKGRQTIHLLGKRPIFRGLLLLVSGTVKISKDIIMLADVHNRLTDAK